MIDSGNDEQVLDRFREWLRQTRQDSAELAETETPALAQPPGFGFSRLVEEFTALRHEIKLQTKSSRTLEERLESALDTLADATSAFQNFEIKAAPNTQQSTDKNFANTLAELDEALDRGREQWERTGPRLVGISRTDLVESLAGLLAKQPWWKKWLISPYQQLVCQQIEQSEEKAKGERKTLLDALLSGYSLLQQRLTRTMANSGVFRISTVGRVVDPEQMIVIEVIESAGSPGQVVEEIRRGYTWNGMLLRPAEVRAIRPRFETESTESIPGNPPQDPGPDFDQKLQRK